MDIDWGKTIILITILSYFKSDFDVNFHIITMTMMIQKK